MFWRSALCLMLDWWRSFRILQAAVMSWWPRPLLYRSFSVSGGPIYYLFLYYRVTVLKPAWYWHRNRQEDQCNWIEDPDINLHTHEHLIFDKEAKNIKWRKESIFNKWCWHNWISICRRMKINTYLSLCTKLKSKWIKDLNIKATTLNFVEEKVGSTVECIGTGEAFLNITTQ